MSGIEQVDNICDLPNEVLCHIFKFLVQDYDQLNASRVCHRWRALYTANKLCPNVKYKLSNWKEFQDFNQLGSTIGLLKITSLDLYEIEFEPNFQYNPDLFSQIEDLVIEVCQFDTKTFIKLFQQCRFKSILFGSVNSSIFDDLDSKKFWAKKTQIQDLKKVIINKTTII